MTSWDDIREYQAKVFNVPAGDVDAYMAALPTEELLGALGRAMAREVPLVDRIVARRRLVAVVLDDVPVDQWTVPLVRDVGLVASGRPGASYRRRWVVLAPAEAAEEVREVLGALSRGVFMTAHIYAHGDPATGSRSTTKKEKKR